MPSGVNENPSDEKARCKLMKRSSGKPSRMYGLNPPRRVGEREPQKKMPRLYKKKSNRLIISLLSLMLLTTALLVIFFMPTGRKNISNSSIQHDDYDTSENQADKKNISMSDNNASLAEGTARKKDGSHNNPADAKPDENKVYDFGTTLRLDPPPVRD
jgi:hypothetical protein